MNKPDFLIAGAMKAGTTTLYYDLARHPDLFLPAFKEPEILVRESDEGVAAAYAEHFRGAAPGQLCGEASTAYTKRPVFEGVAGKALALLGPGLKIVYIRRDPVIRALSHYKHDRLHGLVDVPFDEAVRQVPRYVDFGRYDWQIAPWIEAFGSDQVMEFDLDAYSAARRETLGRVLAFLGVDPDRLRPVDENTVLNSASEAKYIANPLLRATVHSNFYQRRIKPLVPLEWRTRVRRAVLPPVDEIRIDIAPEIARFIREQATLPGEAPG